MYFRQPVLIEIMTTEQTLNADFAIPKQLRFETHASGIVMAVIENQYASATVSLYGGQILSFLPEGETEDVFFLSDSALFGQGKAIRGGSPICWPWFGDDYSGYGRPAHGFARNIPWQVIASCTNEDGSTGIRLGLNDTQESLAVWPYAFSLVLDIVVAKTLTLTLRTKNTGNKPFTISQALHTYFNVSHIDNIAIQGLDNVNYLDKVAGFSAFTQQGDVTVEGEFDRIYTYVPKTITLKDTGFGREIEIHSQGSNSTVIWNPGQETIKRLIDLPDKAYPSFLCIETANAANDVIRLEEGHSHCLTAVYQVKKS